MEVEKRVPAEFAIESVTYRVVDQTGSEVQTGEGGIEDKLVYFLFDSTSDNVTVGNLYTAYFTVNIIGSDKVLKGKVSIRVTS